MKVKIWYSYNHDDATVEEMEFKNQRSFLDWLDRARIFGYIPIQNFYVPWHRVNGIEVVK